MSYRCGFCHEVVPPNTPMKKVTTYRETRVSLDSERTRKEVAKETPVCETCLASSTLEALADKFKTR